MYWGRELARILALAGVYFLAARLGLSFAFAHSSVSPVWPPTGIALAAVILWGTRAWPGIALGALLANALLTPVSVLVAGGIAIGNTLEAVAGGYLIQRIVHARYPFDRAEQFFKFVLVAGVSCTISATIGIMVLYFGGDATSKAYSTMWSTWWLGDTIGMLLVTPLVLGGIEWTRIAWKPQKLAEGLMLLALLLNVGQFVFGGTAQTRVWQYVLAFTFLPIFVWAAFRFGLFGATLTILLTAGMGIWGTIHGFGPFIRGDLNESLLLLQTYIGFSAITIFGMTAILAERDRAVASVSSMNRALESRVQERTKELEDANTILRAHEKSLEQQTEELMRSNAELERFAYLASHDLKEPIRTVSSYVQLLATRYKGRLDKDADDFIHYAVDATQRMDKLIRDVLSYCRAGTRDKTVQSCDVNQILARVRENLATAILETSASLSSDPLPMIVANETEMVQLLQNLIGNAIKFHSQEPPRVHISAGRKRNHWVFMVRDEGIGISPEYQTRIFRIFQRLHNATEYPGTGIGLAICKKIVESYGGQIWVESAPGNGSSFFFNLPA
jgi:signal transduction histidine kinase